MEVAPFRTERRASDLSWGPMREVGEGAVFDLAVAAKRLAEEDSGRGVAVGDIGDVHAYILLYTCNKIKYVYRGCKIFCVNVLRNN